MGLPAAAAVITVLKTLPDVIEGFGKLFGVFLGKQDKRAKAEFDKIFNDLKTELQRDFKLLADNFLALQKTLVILQRTVYVLCGFMFICVLYIALHLSRVVP